VSIEIILPGKGRKDSALDKTMEMKRQWRDGGEYRGNGKQTRIRKKKLSVGGDRVGILR